MGTHKSAGFTIIETTLFLGVSAALILLMVIATGSSLSVQRYRDAVETLKSTLQQQYSDVSAVHNSRDDALSCGVGAEPVDDAVSNVNRGQSDCMLMGKYVRMENDNLAIYQVLGYGTPELEPGNDIDALRDDYTLNVSKASAEVSKSTLEWGAQIAWPVKLNGVDRGGSPTPRKVGILIVRSPDSGRIYTFTANDSEVPDEAALNPASIRAMVVAGNAVPGQGSQVICVKSNGGFTTGDRAIYLSNFAAGASAIETRTNEFMQSLPTGESRC